MAIDLTNAISAVIKRLLYPLVRVLLRQGMPYGAFSDLAKRVYVDVAMQEFGIPGRKQSISRVSIMTGLTRKEVRRIQSLETADDAAAIAQYNRAARVIAGWRRDSQFLDANGNPSELPLEGASASFATLVKRFSGDVPARAVRDELLRVDAAEITAAGSIRLKVRAYVPIGSEVEKVSILGTDVADLLTTITHNIADHASEPFFQRKVAYDNLPIEALAELKPLVNQRAQELLEEFDRWLAARDRDINPEVKGSGRQRAGIGIYYFETDLSQVEKS
ncbi:MAG: DUF6502 family protein [Pseudomonadota bacterium]|nr:DUF6502 family protein [Pseudomonadota bacterium]